MRLVTTYNDKIIAELRRMDLDGFETSDKKFVRVDRDDIANRYAGDEGEVFQTILKLIKHSLTLPADTYVAMANRSDDYFYICVYEGRPINEPASRPSN